MIGRTFTDAEDRDDAKVVVIGYELWQRRYAGARDIAGRTILLDGEAYRVIRRDAARFRIRDRAARVFWIPMHVAPKLRAARGSHYLNCVARLKPGVTIAAASEDMRAIAKRLREQYPDDNRDLGAVVMPMKEDLLGRMQTVLIVLTRCAAGMRCYDRGVRESGESGRWRGRTPEKREIAVRMALGAGRVWLIRQMVTEGALLFPDGRRAGVGIRARGDEAAGRGTCRWGSRRRRNRGLMRDCCCSTLPALSLATGVIFSLIPALLASRASVNDALKQGGRSGARTR